MTAAVAMAGGLQSPLLAHLRPWLDRLPPSPDTAAVALLAAASSLRTESGQALRFVSPQDDGLGYERRIWERGEVETRPDNWHDFFNTLIWLAFPRAKAALNARHLRAMGAEDAPRGQVRDAMTHFDECGLVVVSDNPLLLELVRAFRWKELFWERRADLQRDMRFFVFGHATCEQLLAPFRGLTAKAVLYEVAADWLALTAAEQLAAIDARLAAELAAGQHAVPRDLQPVPLLGLPGMTPDNERPEYYDDTWQFRPGRRQAARV